MSVWNPTHCSAVNDDRNSPMMETHKTYIREKTAQGIKPSWIRNSMPSKFGVDMDSLSSLSKEKNYAYHYKKPKLLNHDKHKDITEFVHKLKFSGHENETTAFTFGWTVNEFGKMFCRKWLGRKSICCWSIDKTATEKIRSTYQFFYSTFRCYVQTQSSRLSGDCLWNFRSVQKLSFGGPICQFTTD
ncbi:hypothetical protein PHMEG_00040086 [Phytophthora megakarya]|uniref:Uncharacterized protein n=1 Tax=Phytophthora megakarya TaxID=4795 RepID=A0A225UE79_9STRA|nr:hypothetical protein PHMEG_00040086 [Phytophthora megakarya]